MDRLTLFEENRGLVHHMITRMRLTRVFDWHWIEDLYQDGYIGLLNATTTFDPTRGKFSNHACVKIRQALVRSMYKYASIVTLREPRNKEEEIPEPLPILSMTDLIGIYTAEDKIVDNYVKNSSERDIYQELREVLTESEWIVIVGKYFYHREEVDIQAELEVSRSKISKLHQQAIIKIKEWIGEIY